MPPPRRKLQETVADTLIPPQSLDDGQLVARIVKAAGKNLYTVELPNTKTLLVELEAKFRSTIWMKRGSFVIVDTTSLADRDNKLDGEIVNIVRDEKRWSKTPYWPSEFTKKATPQNDSDDEGEESNMGKMPPSSSDEE